MILNIVDDKFRGEFYWGFIVCLCFFFLLLLVNCAVLLGVFSFLCIVSFT